MHLSRLHCKGESGNWIITYGELLFQGDSEERFSQIDVFVIYKGKAPSCSFGNVKIRIVRGELPLEGEIPQLPRQGWFVITINAKNPLPRLERHVFYADVKWDGQSEKVSLTPPKMGLGLDIR